MFTDDLVNGWLQTLASTAYVSLHYDDPGLDGVGLSEISGGSYVRVQAFFTQPSNRAIWTANDIRFTGLPATQISHVGIWTVPRGGILQAYQALPKKRIVPAGQGLVITAGQIALSIG